MEMRDIPRLVAAVALPQVVGGASGLVTAEAVRTWYAGLVKPALTPPGPAFGIVWPLLYLAMGVAFFLVWTKRPEPPRRNAALAAFCVQLALNGLWSLLFFGLRSPLAGMVCLAALWAAIAATIALFARVSRAGAWLMAPYLAWVSFAAYLNGAILYLN